MEKLKTFLPYIVALVLFVSLSSVYFAPLYQGYGLRSHDSETSFGMSKESLDYYEREGKSPLWTNSMFGGMPTYQIFLPNKANFVPTFESIFFARILDYPIGYLTLAMLSFYVLLMCFGVNPWLAIVGSIAYGFSSINILYLGAGHITKVHAIALLPGIIGGMFYAYRKNMFIGAALMGFFVCLHVSANHLQMTYYILYLILAVGVVEFYIHYKDKLLNKFFKASAFLAIAGIIGILPTVPGVFLTYEYGKYTTRGESELTISSGKEHGQKIDGGLDRDYIKQYSMSHGEAWSLAIPAVKGGAAGYLGNHEEHLNKVSPEFRNYVAQTNSYWGEQYFSGGAFYFGASMFLLFVLGLFFLKDRIKWAFLAVTILAVFASWKHSAILDLFIDYLPLFKKFRDTKMMLILVQISFPAVGLLFAKLLFDKKLEEKKLIYVLGGTIGLFVLFYILPTVFFDFYSTNDLNSFKQQIAAIGNNGGALQQFNQYTEEIQKARVSLFKADVLRSIGFMIVVGGLVFFFNRKKIGQQYFIGILVVVVLFDLWIIDKKYLNNEKINGQYKSWVKKEDRLNPYKTTKADIQILELETKKSPEIAQKINSETAGITNNIDKYKKAFEILNFNTHYRVFTLQDPFSNASIPYFHKSIGGYHGAKLKIYQELIDFRIFKEYQLLIKTLQENTNDSLFNVLLRDKIPTLNMLNMRYVVYNPEAGPITNPYANGSAWFVGDVKIVDNRNEEIMALNDIDPKTTVVVEKSHRDVVGTDVNFDPNASIELTSYNPNHLIYETSCTTPQVAVFSEIYYEKGWNAYIDGKLVPHFRANYVLRGLKIPEGKHKVEFKFEPKTHTISMGIAWTGSILLVLFIAGMVFIGIKHKTKD